MAEKLTSALASPCIGVCKLDQETGLCNGCMRTRDEIRAWSRAEDDTIRYEILAILKERRKAAGRVSDMDRKPRRRARKG